MLRSPTAQLKYALGVSHDVVVKEVLDEHRVDILKATAADKTAMKAVSGIKTLRSKDRSKMRSQKMDRMNGEFTPQSQGLSPVTQVSNTPWLLIMVAVVSVLLTSAYHNPTGISRALAFVDPKEYVTMIKRLWSLATRGVSVAEAYVDTADKWSKLVTCSTNHLTAETKVIGYEIKTLIHILYHAYMGETSHAIAWATNYCFSRPEMIYEAVKNLANLWPKRVASQAATVVLPDGTTRSVEAKHFVKLNEAYSAGVRGEPLTQLFTDLTKDDFTTQSDQDVVSPLLTIFNALRGCLPKLSDDDVRKANNQFTFMNHHKRYLTDSLNMMGKIISLVTRTFFGCDVLDVAYQEHVARMMSVMQFANGLVTTRDIASDKPAMIAVMDVYKQARDLAVCPQMQAVPGFFMTHYQTRYKILEAKAAEVSSYLTNAHNRMEPTMLFFTGPPGVGKTAAAKFIMQSLSFIDGIPHGEHLVYPFSALSTFWEGYAKQPYVLMDDIFKVANKESRIIESSAVIDMINTSVFNLNMAAIGDKGNNFFDSQYVFASTNLANKGIKCANFNSCGLSDPAAFIRRLHIVLHKEDKLTRDGVDIKDSLWRIDQCIHAPNMEGVSLTTYELVKFIRQIRKVQSRQASSYALNLTQLQGMYGDCKGDGDIFDLSRSPVVAVDTPGFQPQSWLSNWVREVLEDQPKPFIPHEIFMNPHEFFKVALCQGYLGLSPEMVAYAVPAFYIITALAAGSTFYYMMCAQELAPSEPQMSFQSQPQRFHTVRGVQVTRRPNEKLGGRGLRKAKAKARLFRHDPTRGGFAVQSSQTDYFRSLLVTVSRSVVEIEAHTRGLKDVCVASHIKDGRFLVPGHFFLQFLDEPEVNMILRWGGQEFNFPFPYEKYIQMAGEDAVIFCAPRSNVDLPPPLYPYFQSASESYVEVIEGCPMTLLFTDGDTPQYRKVHRAAGCSSVNYSHDNEVYVTVNPYTYHEHTFSGESGAVLTVQGKDSRPIALGMHIGRKNGAGQCGVSLPLCREDLDNLMEDFEPQSVLASAKQRFDDFPFEVTRISDLPARSTGRSKLFRTDLYNWAGTCTRKPARHRAFQNANGDVVDPMMVALSKLKQVYTLPTDIPPGVMGFLHKSFPRPTDFAPGPVSYDEALRGDFRKGSKGICFSTSSGYPFSLLKGNYKGKGPYIVKSTLANGYDTLDYEPGFLAQTMEVDRQLRQGTKCVALWADCTKDELRKNEKADEGKTRLIATCPLDYLILYRRYFLDFITASARIAATAPVAVGINPHSVDWTVLYSRLNVPGNSIISGDYSNFDGKLPKFVGEVFLRFVNEWYDDGEEAATARITLVENVYAAMRINGKYVYQVADGNPSGNPITSIYNSICNVVMLYVVVVVYLKVDPSLWRVSTYGDDNISSLPVPGLRCSHIAGFIKDRFGLEYTHSSKADDPVDTMETAVYLGRSFRTGETNIRAPLSMTIIQEIPYYMTTKDQQEVTMVSMASSLYLELHHHGKDVYKERSDAFLSAILKSPVFGGQYGFIAETRQRYEDLFRKMYVEGGVDYYSTTPPLTPTIPSLGNCD